MGASAFSQHTAQLIDDEVRRLSQEAHQEATDIIQSHRKEHKIIAEALLKYETLDEKQILSLFKTGEMPVKAASEFPSEKAATFEESKRELERREAEKQAEQQSATAENSEAADTTNDASEAEPSFPSESQASSEVSAAPSATSSMDSEATSAATSETGLPHADSAASSDDDTNSQA